MMVVLLSNISSIYVVMCVFQCGEAVCVQVVRCTTRSAGRIPESPSTPPC